MKKFYFYILMAIFLFPFPVKTTILSMDSVLLVSFVHAQETQEKRYITPSKNPQNVYFGDPHVHTRISLDAAMWGSSLGPKEASEYAKGAEFTSFKGWKAKLLRPMDWVVISDHSDFYGFYQRMVDGDPFIVNEPLGKRYYDLLKEGKKQTSS